jgi:hypothetical protein
MEDKKPQNDEQAPQNTEVVKSVPKKGSNFKWILLAVFAVMIIRPFFKAKPPELAWQDYETGVKLAQELDKPILLAFYKAGERFCTDMWANTYANETTIKFIEDNFVPIFVDVVKQPNLAKEYKISYYPTHFLKTPDNKEILKTRRGYDTPTQFKPFLLEGLERAGKEPIETVK